LIQINSKYFLTPLLSVRNDNLNEIFKDKRVLYVNNWADEEWHKRHNLSESRNYSINKFNNFFKFFNSNSMVLSPTFTTNEISTQTYRNSNIIHIGSNIKNLKLSLIHKTFKSFLWIFQNRNDYDCVFVHNYQFPLFYIGLFAKYFLHKELIIDFEDDYYCLNPKNIQSKLFHFFFRKLDIKIVAINEKMFKYFKVKKDFFVFNGFIDLNYLNENSFLKKNKMLFLISGTLNLERGVFLIPEVVKAFRNYFESFKIIITGNVENKNINLISEPEIEYLGFVSEADYQSIISQTDICLVLQLPDHPFNEGSFPSKIESFSALKKPILILNCYE